MARVRPWNRRKGYYARLGLEKRQFVYLPAKSPVRGIHPVAHLLPRMTDDEYHALKADINRNGLREKIWTWNGQIIDGRHRYQACRELGRPYLTREWDGEGSLVEFVLSLNMHRRHLSASQRAALAVDVERQLAVEAEQRKGGRPRKDQKPPQKIADVSGEARQQAAQLTGTNRQYVSDAKRIAATDTELLEAVKDGTLTISDAKAMVDLPADVRKQVLDTITDQPTPEQPRTEVKTAALKAKGAPAYLIEAVDTDQLTATQATDLYAAILKADRAVTDACIRGRVLNRGVVRLLNEKRETNTAQSILASGYLQFADKRPAIRIDLLTETDITNALREGEKEHRAAARDLRIAQRLAEIRRAPEGVRSVVYADPAWEYENSGFDMSAEKKYPTMPTDKICTLLTEIHLEVAESAVCFMWATNPLLPDALRVMAAWGFEYKSNMVWDKEAHTGGFYVFGQHELLLIGTRGSLLPDYRPISVLRWKRTDHSVKPAMHATIESMYPGQRYIELFARNNATREGWAFWGNEANHESAAD